MDEAISLENLVLRRVDQALQQAQLNDRPVFAMTAETAPNSRFPTLFAGANTPLVHALDHPPSLRRAGFDLEAGETRIVRGDLRRALVQTWKVMELWRDGLLIYGVDAYVQPCWGKWPPSGGLRVNPLALSEPVFCLVN